MEHDRLRRDVTDADYVKDLLKHPGMILLRKKAAERLARARRDWYKASTPAEAEYIRQEARNLDAFFNIVKHVILTGENARKILSGLPPSDVKAAE